MVNIIQICGIEKMKKPKKKKKLIKEESNLISLDTPLHPDTLRDIANEMDRQGIFAVMIEGFGYDACFECYHQREETNNELNSRYQKELKEYEKYKAAQKTKKEREKAEIIKKAKELGLKISE